MNDQNTAMVLASHVSKSYKNGDSNLLVLKDVSFSLTIGESAVILGKSGSGKSTLLHLIGGLDRVDSGNLEVGGQQVDAMKEKHLEEYRRSSVGFIFQSHYLLDDFTLLENVYLPAVMSGFPKKEAISKARDLLEHVGLSDRQSHFPRKVSGGERQRAAAARALINDPAVILADEPTGNLDEYNSKLVEDMLFSLVETYHRTMILVTHDQVLAERGSRVYNLHLGELTAV